MEAGTTQLLRHAPNAGEHNMLKQPGSWRSTESREDLMAAALSRLRLAGLS